MEKVLIISFDALGDKELDLLSQYPNTHKFLSTASLTRDVDSIYLSNTYPIHASVCTGVLPNVHGILSNVEPFPTRNPVWITDSRKFKAKTLWQAAAEKGLKTATVMWPVTAFSKDINYNIPEVMARPGKSQTLTSLKAGSKSLQLKEFLRHRHLLDGINHPNLDHFSTACMVDIIKEKQPDLMMLHLTCYDTFCHKYGKHYDQLKIAFESLDEDFGKVLSAIDEQTTVIIFSDHSQLNIESMKNPNHLLRDLGYLEMDDEDNVTRHRCFIECCGGSAFFYNRDLTREEISQVKNTIMAQEDFHYFLTSKQMKDCGRSSLDFGFCAKTGFCYEVDGHDKKGQHGYPLDYENYKVFYAVRDSNQETSDTRSGGSLLDIAPIIAEKLSLNMPQLKGETI